MHQCRTAIIKLWFSFIYLFHWFRFICLHLLPYVYMYFGLFWRFYSFFALIRSVPLICLTLGMASIVYFINDSGQRCAGHWCILQRRHFLFYSHCIFAFLLPLTHRRPSFVSKENLYVKTAVFLAHPMNMYSIFDGIMVVCMKPAFLPSSSLTGTHNLSIWIEWFETHASYLMACTMVYSPRITTIRGWVEHFHSYWTSCEFVYARACVCVLCICMCACVISRSISSFIRSFVRSLFFFRFFLSSRRWKF